MEVKPLSDLGHSPMLSLAASRISYLKVSHNSTGSSRVSSNPKQRDCLHILLSTCQVLQFFKMKHSMVISWRLSGLQMKLECSPKNPAILEDSPMITYWQRYDWFPLLCFTKSSNAALVSDTKNLQFRRKLLSFIAPDPLEPTQLIASSLSACDIIEVAQNNECGIKTERLPSNWLTWHRIYLWCEAVSWWNYLCCLAERVEIYLILL